MMWVWLSSQEITDLKALMSVFEITEIETLKMLAEKQFKMRIHAMRQKLEEC